MNSRARFAVICAVLIYVAGVLWLAATSQHFSTALTYSQFLEKVRTRQIGSAIVMGRNAGAIQAICRLKDGNAARTILPSDCRDAMAAMQEKLVDVEIRDASSGPKDPNTEEKKRRCAHGELKGPGQSIFPWLASGLHERSYELCRRRKPPESDRRRSAPGSQNCQREAKDRGSRLSSNDRE